MLFAYGQVKSKKEKKNSFTTKNNEENQ